MSETFSAPQVKALAQEWETELLNLREELLRANREAGRVYTLKSACAAHLKTLGSSETEAYDAWKAKGYGLG